MAKDPVFEKVKKIIVDRVGVDEEQIELEASFIDDLGADSLEIVDLIMAFESEFGLNISDEDAENLVTVSDAVGYLKESSKES